MKARGGMWSYLIAKGQKDKALARHYVSQNVRRGKLFKEPCKVCGELKVQAHHYLGYEREHWLDVAWLCKQHHPPADRGEIKFDKIDGNAVVVTQLSCE